MTRHTTLTLVLLAMLTLALVALQCPRFDCAGCAGDEVVAKQSSSLWVPTGATIVAAAGMPTVCGSPALFGGNTPSRFPDLHQRSCPLLI